MGFKSDYIFNQLKHNPKQSISEIISNDVLFEFLWYFVSKESYAQRINIFNSIFDKPSPYDRFFLMWLYKELQLDELRVYTNKMVDLDKDVDSLSSSDLSKDLLYIHAKGTAIFTSLFEKMRNSIAHGTFNRTNRFIMIGQVKSKIDSPMNFYYQTNGDYNNRFKSLLKLLQEMSDIREMCKEALVKNPNVKEQDSLLFYGGKQIVIEHQFKFNPVSENGSEITQIKALENEKSYNNTLIILCCPSHGAFIDDELKSKNVGIIPYTHLHSFFGYNILFK